MRLGSLFIIVCFLVLVYSFWHRNDLPAEVEPVPELLDAPRQTSTDVSSFTATSYPLGFLQGP